MGRRAPSHATIEREVGDPRRDEDQRRAAAGPPARGSATWRAAIRRATPRPARSACRGTRAGPSPSARRSRSGDARDLGHDRRRRRQDELLTSNTRTSSSHSPPTTAMPTSAASRFSQPDGRVPRRAPFTAPAPSCSSVPQAAFVEGEERRPRPPARRAAGRASAIGSTADDPPRPGRQHDHPVRQEHGLGHGVGDEHDRGRQLLAQAGEQVAHVGAGDLVERGERLVHQQQRRTEGHRPHQRDALAHPARQLVRVGVGEVGEADRGEQLLGASARTAPEASRFTSSSRRALRATVRHGSSAGDCGTNPMRLAATRLVRAGAVDGDAAGARLVERRRSGAAASSCRCPMRRAR